MQYSVDGKIYTLSDDEQLRSLTYEKGIIRETTDERANKLLPDAANKIILPAFTDAHTHFFQTGLMLSGLDLSGVASRGEALAIVAESLKERDWVQCWGYDPAGTGVSLPTKSELNKISADKPIFIRRRDGHSSALNDAAFSLVKSFIDKLDFVDYDKGYLFDKAHLETDRYFLNDADETELHSAMNAVIDLALSRGVVRIGALVHRRDWMELLLKWRSEWRIDIVPFLESWDVHDAVELGLPRIGGCLLLDGSFGSHTAALRESYSDAPQNSGHLYKSDSELADFLEQADEAGLQTTFHAIGDRAIEQHLRVFREIVGESGNPRRHRIEHSELLPDDLLDEVARLGLILSMQPAFEREWGGMSGMYGVRLGARAMLTNRFASLIERGVIVAGGSDSYVTPIDPLGGIAAAVNHPNANERVSVRDAVRMFTYNGAYANFCEGHSGTLEAGLSADFVVLDGDPFEVPPNRFADISILATVYRGDVVFIRQGV